MADFPSLPASSRWPECSTVTVNLRLRWIMGRDFESFSTDRASIGGSKEICVNQLAVKMLTSPSSAQDMAYRPYVNARRACFFVFSSMFYCFLYDISYSHKIQNPFSDLIHHHTDKAGNRLLLPLLAQSIALHLTRASARQRFAK